jgi:glucose-1-phosphate thymidylyltransferase
MKGIILHGGHGDRLRPLTHTGAKQLIPVANKPISQYVLEDIRNSGITQIAIVLGDINPEKVKKYYAEGQRFQVKIKYIRQGEPKGIAHAVNLCRSYVNDDLFVVYLGDNLLKGGITNLVKKFRHSKQDAMILLNQVENPQRFGVAKFDKKGKLVQLIEKPKKPPSKLALTGIYFFKPVIFKMIKELKPSWRGELEITEAIQMLLDKGYKVGYQTVKGWWKDTGTPEDILEANRLVLDELEAKIESSTSESLSIQGRVSIGKDTTIEKGCTIRGPSIIGHHTTIKKDVYIGPYTSLGNYTTILSGEIENSIIMDHCYIDIDDRITTSLIGSHSTISSNKNHRPKGRRFLIGERSNIEL